MTTEIMRQHYNTDRYDSRNHDRKHYNTDRELEGISTKDVYTKTYFMS
jgi:hypothetical protein